MFMASIALKISEIDPLGLIESSARTFEGQLKDREIRLTKKVDDNLPTIKADAGKILWVLVSFIGNAMRYTHRWGRITVSARKIEGYIQFNVTDTGNGVEASKLEKIFLSEFIFSGKSEFSASGIALPIAREIAEAHGGKVEASSQLGRGSTFSLYLPI